MDISYWFTIAVILLIGLGAGFAGGIYYSRKNETTVTEPSQAQLDMQSHLQKQINDLKTAIAPPGENTWEETKAKLLEHFKALESKAAETSKEILYAVTAIEQVFSAKHGETTNAIQEAIAFIEQLTKDELAKFTSPVEASKEAVAVVPVPAVVATPVVQAEPKLEVNGETKVES